ncbi:MAG: Hpt domain-containing protein [Opitutaceae bacterium]|nr:Hpt domain-containing protein [Opitutaceae bacterium]
MPEHPVIDQLAIENLRSLSPGNADEFLREIIGIFLEDTPKRVAELEQYLAAGDAIRFARTAHSIKGSASNLGATALRAVAENLERQSAQNGLADVGPLCVKLEAEFGRTRAELTRLLPARPA